MTEVNATDDTGLSGVATRYTLRMRILITGAGGQLGRSLLRAFDGDDVTALSRAELDVSDAAAVAHALESARPDAVVHAAALTDTALCEREPELALAVNATGSEHVARACDRAGARLVAVSTNEVFEGRKREPYREDDEPAPLNVYGRSKLAGEERARAACPQTLVVRTAWLYGEGGNNFVEKVRAAASAGKQLRFVDDEIATPTSTDDLADAIRRLLEADAAPGIYHLANAGEASRYDWARAILDECGMRDVPIERVTTRELRASGYAGPEKPAYSVLANAHAAALGVTMRPWPRALAAYLERSRLPLNG